MFLTKQAEEEFINFVKQAKEATGIGERSLNEAQTPGHAESSTDYILEALVENRIADAVTATLKQKLADPTIDLLLSTQGVKKGIDPSTITAFKFQLQGAKLAKAEKDAEKNNNPTTPEAPQTTEEATAPGSDTKDSIDEAINTAVGEEGSDPNTAELGDVPTASKPTASVDFVFHKTAEDTSEKQSMTREELRNLSDKYATAMDESKLKEELAKYTIDSIKLLVDSSLSFIDATPEFKSAIYDYVAGAQTHVPSVEKERADVLEKKSEENEDLTLNEESDNGSKEVSGQDVYNKFMQDHHYTVSEGSAEYNALINYGKSSAELAYSILAANIDNQSIKPDSEGFNLLFKTVLTDNTHAEKLLARLESEYDPETYDSYINMLKEQLGIKNEVGGTPKENPGANFLSNLNKNKDSNNAATSGVPYRRLSVKECETLLSGDKYGDEYMNVATYIRKPFFQLVRTVAQLLDDENLPKSTKDEKFTKLKNELGASTDILGNDECLMRIINHIARTFNLSASLQDTLLKKEAFLQEIYNYKEEPSVYDEILKTAKASSDSLDFFKKIAVELDQKPGSSPEHKGKDMFNGDFITFGGGNTPKFPGQKLTETRAGGNAAVVTVFPEGSKPAVDVYSQKKEREKLTVIMDGNDTIGFVQKLNDTSTMGEPADYNGIVTGEIQRGSDKDTGAPKAGAGHVTTNYLDEINKLADKTPQSIAGIPESKASLKNETIKTESGFNFSGLKKKSNDEVGTNGNTSFIASDISIGDINVYNGKGKHTLTKEEASEARQKLLKREEELECSASFYFSFHKQAEEIEQDPVGVDSEKIATISSMIDELKQEFPASYNEVNKSATAGNSASFFSTLIRNLKANIEKGNTENQQLIDSITQQEAEEIMKSYFNVNNQTPNSDQNQEETNKNENSDEDKKKGADGLDDFLEGLGE